MKTKRILIIIIILITIITGTLFLSSNLKLKTKNNKQTPTFKDTNYWVYYKDESYNDNGEKYDESKEDNSYIKIEKSIITLCSKDPDRCETSKYEKKGNEYEIEENSVLKKLNFEFKDAYDEEYGKIIQVTKYYPTNPEINYVIFYFKKAN